MENDSKPAAAPLSPRAVRAELADLGRGARKRLGQHFLTDRHVAERIVRTADLRDGESVVEIGPGLGALTDSLAARAAHLWLVELDSDLGERARQRYAQRASVHVVTGDALEIDFDVLLGALPPAVLVANLPYNVATAILARLVERPDRFSRMVIMVQHEVALRIVAGPGTKAYGPLSVMTQIAAVPRIAFRVPPTAFVPRPKVDSAVVAVTLLSEPPVDIRDRRDFRRVVRAAFGQRRKHLANSLKTASTDAAGLLAAAGIDPTRRPETLSLEEFARISNLLPAFAAAVD